MTTTTIRIAIGGLPDHLDRSRMDTILDDIEITIADEGGVYGTVSADSNTINIEVQTGQLVDATTVLAEAKYI